MDISPAALVNAATQRQQSQVAQTAQVLVLKKAMYIHANGALAVLQALPLATSGNQGTQANTMAYCHSALVFGQLLLNKGVNLLSALHGLVAQRGNLFG